MLGWCFYPVSKPSSWAFAWAAIAAVTAQQQEWGSQHWAFAFGGGYVGQAKSTVAGNVVRLGRCLCACRHHGPRARVHAGAAVRSRRCCDALAGRRQGQGSPTVVQSRLPGAFCSRVSTAFVCGSRVQVRACVFAIRAVRAQGEGVDR